MGQARLRERALRLGTLAWLAPTRPAWAKAHILNYMRFRSDRRDRRSDSELARIELFSPRNALIEITGANAASVDAVLDAVPQPSLHRESVLYGSPNASTQLVRLSYALCRLLRPGFVLETGVANGFSSAAILQALEENGRGVLASIDLPHLHPRAVSSVGAAVQPSYRSRWRLRLGGVDDLLPSVLEDSPEVDIFVQDASHTVAGQLTEFRAAWPRIRSGGILMADDVTPALALFHREAGGRAMLVRQAKEARIGVLVKTRAEVP